MMSEKLDTIYEIVPYSSLILPYSLENQQQTRRKLLYTFREEEI